MGGRKMLWGVVASRSATPYPIPVLPFLTCVGYLGLSPVFVHGIKYVVTDILNIAGMLHIKELLFAQMDSVALSEA